MPTERELQTLQGQIATYEDEMKTPLIVSLSEEERSEIQVLIERSQQLQGIGFSFFLFCLHVSLFIYLPSLFLLVLRYALNLPFSFLNIHYVSVD